MLYQQGTLEDVFPALLSVIETIETDSETREVIADGHASIPIWGVENGNLSSSAGESRMKSKPHYWSSRWPIYSRYGWWSWHPFALRMLARGMFSYIAKIISGNVNQSQRRFMTESEIEAGYTVTCVAYPLSDCVLETHQQQVLYSSSLYGPKAQ